MAINNMNDGMGKKIVEALKMQTLDHSNGEVFINEAADDIVEDTMSFDTESDSTDETFNTNVEPEIIQQPSPLQMKVQSQLQFQAATQPQSIVDTAFQQSIIQNLGTSAYAQVQDDFDYPANVAVLKQLIAKLPSGVSKQTGALIIKQTMEALGISMGTVLQEAKHVQETLTNNSVECQNNIVEYRKQIGILEAKSQNYQRQAAVMNDIINLFIQTR